MNPDIEPIVERYPAGRRDVLIPLLQEVQANCGLPVARRRRPHRPAPAAARQQGLRRRHLLQPVPLPAARPLPRPGLPRHRLPREEARSRRSRRSSARSSIKPGQTSRDGLFSLEVVACLGACGLAPVIAVNGEFHAGATPERVHRDSQGPAEGGGAAMSQADFPRCCAACWHSPSRPCPDLVVVPLDRPVLPHRRRLPHLAGDAQRAPAPRGARSARHLHRHRHVRPRRGRREDAGRHHAPPRRPRDRRRGGRGRLHRPVRRGTAGRHPAARPHAGELHEGHREEGRAPARRGAGRTSGADGDAGPVRLGDRSADRTAFPASTSIRSSRRRRAGCWPTAASSIRRTSTSTSRAAATRASPTPCAP